jgi:hypothetical protein
MAHDASEPEMSRPDSDGTTKVVWSPYHFSVLPLTPGRSFDSERDALAQAA